MKSYDSAKKGNALGDNAERKNGHERPSNSARKMRAHVFAFIPLPAHTIIGNHQKDTLHNEDEIKRLGVKIGDSVVVGRAGDVIPDIKKVLLGLRTGKEKNFHMPKHCPVCGKEVGKKQGEVNHFCVNKNCPARHRESLYHFVSRKAFNIEGLGPKILDAFLDYGLIYDAADIFKLKESDIIPLERFGEKSAENLVREIKKSRKISLPRFIYSLGILHAGEE